LDTIVPTERKPRGGASLQSRVTVVAMVTSVVVLLATSTAFVAAQLRSEQRGALALQDALTRALAGGETIKPAFRDPRGAPRMAVRMTNALPDREGVAFLVDARGRLIGAKGFATPQAAVAEGYTLTTRPVRIDDRPAGALIIGMRPPGLMAVLLNHLSLVCALIFLALGLSLFLGRWLSARVIRPVERVSEAMHRISVSGDFSQKVERGPNDELGRLTDTFNELVAELHVNDTQLRRTMVELMNARDAAEAANKLKSQFLANMSHEIRTPLNGLLAMSQVMALDELAPGQRARLEVVRSSGEALLSILNDVLDVSKIEAGKLELEIGEFDGEAVARSAFAPFTAVAEERGLELRLEVEDGARGVRLGDASRLRQILTNLVSNALKFTEAGSVHLALRGAGEDGAEGLFIAVTDTGIGIAPDVAPLLFQKFTQADASTTRRFGGTGLGLAICHDLVQLMGGRIWVESVEGCGSTFHVELPLRRTAEVAAAPTASPAPARPAEPEAGRPLRVLAAEDNPTNQLVLKTILDIFGVELTMVGNGRLAVEAWRDGGFDLILMDIQMPEMDGLSATRAIRAAESAGGLGRIPIVALSAHAMTHQVQEYLDAGIDIHVPKPIELPKLQAALQQAQDQTADRTRIGPAGRAA
jgi:signal transduction histidine kinase/AmiR/NasT family two-component response regulator